MNRRAVLALFAGTSLISPGCPGRIDDSEDPVQLCRVGITSRHTESLHGEIRVLQDDEVVVEYSGEIRPAEDGTVDGVETTKLGGIMVPEEDIPAKSGRYHIQMRITGENVELEDAFDTAEAVADHVTIAGFVENRKRERWRTRRVRNRGYTIPRRVWSFTTRFEDSWKRRLLRMLLRERSRSGISTPRRRGS